MNPSLRQHLDDRRGKHVSLVFPAEMQLHAARNVLRKGQHPAILVLTEDLEDDATPILLVFTGKQMHTSDAAGTSAVLLARGSAPDGFCPRVEAVSVAADD